MIMKDVKMPAEMKLKEETPTKIVLETDSSSRKWAEYLRMLIIPLLLLAGVLIITNFPTWMNWVMITLAVIIEMVMILAVYSELVHVTVTIDMDSQRATRIEKFFFVRMKKIELDFNQINRVLIHCEEQGHHCRLLLDSIDSKPLVIDFYLPLEEKQKASLLLSKKIGALLKKPAVMKVTDLGNVISENRI